MARTTRRGAMALIAALPAAAAAAPKSRLADEIWLASGDAPGPDAGPWAEILARRRGMGADGVARFDYAAARADGPALRAWIEAQARADPTRMTREAQFAYWADLYNALTVDLVLEAWPVDTIRKVRGGLFNLGPWDETVVRVAGRDLSLDAIEHGVMRPVFRDPRVHYAVNCASIGCPDLPERPWAGAALSARLDVAARAYVNHPRGAAVEGGRLIVSSIYAWFEEDFGGGDAGVLAHLRRHAGPGLSAALAGRDRIDGDRYDWAINAP